MLTQNILVDSNGKILLYDGQTLKLSSGDEPKKYSLLQRISDDNNNEIGTVSGFFKDSNDDEYAVICLDAQYRAESGFWTSNTSSIQTIPNLPRYSSGFDKWWYDCTKELATTNTQLILDYNDQNGYTSTACSHCRNKSFVIDGITYYGQLPNIREVFDIWTNRLQIEVLDSSASSYPALNFSTYRPILSSTAGSSGLCWKLYSTMSGTGAVTTEYFAESSYRTNFIAPVLEILNI